MNIIFYFILLRYGVKEISTTHISYMNLERPKVTYVNSSCAKNLSFTCRRLANNRKDPRHYVNIYLQTLIPIGNDFKIDVYFYQFLTNRYQPSFVNLHYSFCDMVEKDPFVGSEFKKHLANKKCPYPPGQYNFTNMAAPFVPKNFPFRRGRIYANFTFSRNNVVIQAFRGYTEMEIKEMFVNNTNNVKEMFLDNTNG